MTMRVREVPIGDVVPYEGNPRDNEAAVPAVAESLREFGWRQPIVVDADMTVVCGHTRLKAARHLGMETVPVVVADDLTAEQVAAYRLADNRTAELAEWDAGLLALELDGLAGFDMGRFGFDESDAAVDGDPLESVAEDAAPEVEDAPTRVKRGEVWLLGRHRLLCGDATDPADTARLAGGGCRRPPADRPALQRGGGLPRRRGRAGRAPHAGRRRPDRQRRLARRRRRTR